MDTRSGDSPRYTISQAADLIGVTAQTLRQWDRYGWLTAPRIGTARIYSDALVEQGKRVRDDNQKRMNR